MNKTQKLYLLLINVILVNVTFALTGPELVTKMETLTKPMDMQSDMKMTLINKKGKTKTMTFRSFVKNQGEKQIMWFLSPPADKGISFLKIEESGKPDRMQMWLPAFKKVRRISSKKKNDAFMGSDMSYEDLYNRDKNDFKFSIIGEERIEDQEFYILESLPIPELKSAYSKHLTWVNKSTFIPHREQSFDKKGLLLKEKQFQFTTMGMYQILMRIYVSNIQKSHATEITFDNVSVDVGLDDGLFHERHLKRIPLIGE